MQNRWNSPVLRVAIGALILFAGKQFFKVELPQELLDKIADVILLIISAVGVANNPNDAENF